MCREESFGECAEVGVALLYVTCAHMSMVPFLHTHMYARARALHLRT